MKSLTRLFVVFASVGSLTFCKSSVEAPGASKDTKAGTSERAVAGAGLVESCGGDYATDGIPAELIQGTAGDIALVREQLSSLPVGITQVVFAKGQTTLTVSRQPQCANQAEAGGNKSCWEHSAGKPVQIALTPGAIKASAIKQVLSVFFEVFLAAKFNGDKIVYAGKSVDRRALEKDLTLAYLQDMQGFTPPVAAGQLAQFFNAKLLKPGMTAAQVSTAWDSEMTEAQRSANGSAIIVATGFQFYCNTATRDSFARYANTVKVLIPSLGFIQQAFGDGEPEFSATSGGKYEQILSGSSVAPKQTGLGLWFPGQFIMRRFAARFFPGPVGDLARSRLNVPLAFPNAAVRSNCSGGGNLRGFGLQDGGGTDPDCETCNPSAEEPSTSDELAASTDTDAAPQDEATTETGDQTTVDDEAPAENDQESTIDEQAPAEEATTYDDSLENTTAVPSYDEEYLTLR